MQILSGVDFYLREIQLFETQNHIQISKKQTYKSTCKEIRNEFRIITRNSNWHLLLRIYNIMIISEITLMLNEYFEVLQSQEISTFDRVFHPHSVLYSTQDGETVVRPLAEYREMVQNRESPRSRGCKTHNEILMIDVMSPEMAMVKVRLRLYDNIMVDYLCLLKVEGKWTIASKFFHKEGAA